MLIIDGLGMCTDPRIKAARAIGIETGTLVKIKGIIVHQTDSSTAQCGE